MDRPQIFEKLNSIAAAGGDVFAALRDMPIDVVADAMLDIPPEYSAARAELPRMADDSVQDSWTGNHGHTLLFQSSAFVHAVEAGFLKHAGSDLRDVKILDYGCGWGRLMRLMYKFTAPENLYGCDPWKKSIDLCLEAGIRGNLAVCDYLPKAIPFPEVKFDLIYAFSVFTHLSEHTAKVVLSAIRQSIKPGGLLAVTVRPESYWYVHKVGNTPTDLGLMHARHRANLFAFTPHNSSTSFGVIDRDGLNTYGDSSCSLEYIHQHWSEWEIVGTDVMLLDPYQTIVFLSPARNA